MRVCRGVSTISTKPHSLETREGPRAMKKKEQRAIVLLITSRCSTPLPSYPSSICTRALDPHNLPLYTIVPHPFLLLRCPLPKHGTSNRTHPTSSVCTTPGCKFTGCHPRMTWPCFPCPSTERCEVLPKAATCFDSPPAPRVLASNMQQQRSRSCAFT